MQIASSKSLTLTEIHFNSLTLLSFNWVSKFQIYPIQAFHPIPLKIVIKFAIN